MEQSDLVYVKRVKGKGRGVFARKYIPRGRIIERVPILLVPTDQLIGGRWNPLLSRFFFEWARDQVAITLGYGSLYNHSYRANAHYRHGVMSMDYFALRAIEPGEEITINYNGDPKDKSPMSFRVVENAGQNGKAKRVGEKNKT